jgi:hypothetical protein
MGVLGLVGVLGGSAYAAEPTQDPLAGLPDASVTADPAAVASEPAIDQPSAIGAPSSSDEFLDDRF